MVLGVTGASVFADTLPQYFNNLYDGKMYLQEIKSEDDVIMPWSPGTMRYSPFFVAMYSLFICVTQDGWVDILNLFKVLIDFLSQ